MTVTTAGTALHTYFGPVDRPLFGTFHLPESGLARGAVVICPPLGKEQGDTTRGQRLVAELLAARGIATLRFDYLHTGESWGDQTDPAAARRLLPSLRAALDFVRTSGASDVAIVGLRAGALVAGQLDEAERQALTGLLLWDPVLRGATYVRAERFLYQTAFDDDSQQGEICHLIGASWHADAIEDLRQWSVGADLPDRLGDRFAIATDDAEAPAVAKLVAAGAAVVPIADPAPFVKPNSFFVEVPVAAARSIVGWLAGRFTGPAVQLGPVVRTSAIMSDPEATRRIVSHVHALPGGPVSWTTEPADEASGCVLVAHSTANDIRTGPARLWVEAARAFAADGVRTVRLDRTGVGEGGPVNAVDDYRPIHSEESVRDALAVTPDGLPVLHAGICSGGWVAARAGLAHPHSSGIVLINHLMWRKHTEPFSREDLVRMGVSAPTGSGQADGPAGTTFFYRYRAKLQPIVSRVLPFWAWRLLGRFRIAQVPDLLLSAFAKRRIPTDLVFSGPDHDLFLSQRAQDSLDRLRAHGWAPEVVVADGGDHAGLHWRIRQASEAACREVLTDLRTPGERNPG